MTEQPPKNTKLGPFFFTKNLAAFSKKKETPHHIHESRSIHIGSFDYDRCLSVVFSFVYPQKERQTGEECHVSERQ